VIAYPDEVMPLVRGLVARVKDVVGDDLAAVYLYGSAVGGGFDPGVSDVDLVALMRRSAADLDVHALGRLHRGFTADHPEWTDRIEVAYVSAVALASFRTDPGPLAVISPGEPFHLRHDPLILWLQNWYLVRQTGIAVHGPAPILTVPEIAWSEFESAAAGYGAQLSSREVVDAGPGAAAYAVLTMCRVLCTLRTGEQRSKQEAAAWTSARMPEWAWLIKEALACRLSRGREGFRDHATTSAASRFLQLIQGEIGR